MPLCLRFRPTRRQHPSPHTPDPFPPHLFHLSWDIIPPWWHVIAVVPLSVKVKRNPGNMPQSSTDTSHRSTDHPWNMSLSLLISNLFPIKKAVHAFETTTSPAAPSRSYHEQSVTHKHILLRDPQSYLPKYIPSIHTAPQEYRVTLSNQV